jgi:effector-binding domain-containing protein
MIDTIQKGRTGVLTGPTIVARPEQPYVAIRATMPMNEMDEAAPRLFREIQTWVSEKALICTGAPILKHNVIDMERELELEFGVPIAEPVPGDDRVISGVLPSGRYATILYRGPYGGPDDDLLHANGALIDWGMKHGIKWDSQQIPAGERFACRLEIYLTGPDTESDPAKWETEVTIKIADV